MESRSVEAALDSGRRFRVRLASRKGTHFHWLDPPTERSHDDHRDRGTVAPQDLSHEGNLRQLARGELRPSPAASHANPGDGRQGRREPPEEWSHGFENPGLRWRGGRSSNATATSSPTSSPQETSGERCDGTDQSRPGHLACLIPEVDMKLLPLESLYVFHQGFQHPSCFVQGVNCAYETVHCVL